MAGPIIHDFVDPRTAMFRDFISRAQANRFEKDLQKEQQKQIDKAKGKENTGAAVGAAIGLGVAAIATGGLALAAAPAGTAGIIGAVNAGTSVLPAIAAANAAGATAGAGGTLAALALGASAGAQAGRSFAGGDVAGGISAVAGGVSEGIDLKNEIDTYGKITSPEEKRSIQAVVSALGTTLPQAAKAARQSGMPLTDYLSRAVTEGGIRKERQTLANKMGVTVDYLDSVAEQHGGDYTAALTSIQQQQHDIGVGNEVVRRRAMFYENMRQVAGQLGLAPGPTPGSQRKFLQAAEDAVAVREGVGKGEITPEQELAQLDELDRRARAIAGAPTFTQKPPPTPAEIIRSNPPIDVPVTDSEGKPTGEMVRMVFSPREGGYRESANQPTRAQPAANIALPDGRKLEMTPNQVQFLPDGTRITTNRHGEPSIHEPKQDQLFDFPKELGREFDKAAEETVVGNIKKTRSPEERMRVAREVVEAKENFIKQELARRQQPQQSPQEQPPLQGFSKRLSEMIQTDERFADAFAVANSIAERQMAGGVMGVAPEEKTSILHALKKLSAIENTLTPDEVADFDRMVLMLADVLQQPDDIGYRAAIGEAR